MTQCNRHCAYCGYNYYGQQQCPECDGFATRPISQCRNSHTIGQKTDYKGNLLEQSNLTP